MIFSPQESTDFAKRHAHVLSELKATATIILNDWRFHSPAIVHGEDPSIDDSTWEPVLLKAQSPADGANADRGVGWYRTTIILPVRVRGKCIEGTQLHLEIGIIPEIREDFPMVRVFVNGLHVGGTKGIAWRLTPVVISSRTIPGTTLQLAVHITSRDRRAAFQFKGAKILIRYHDHADPTELRNELIALDTMVSGLAGNRPDYRDEIETAVHSIDFTALDRGDESVFVESLERACTRLHRLREWTRRFSIRAVGHAHIDTAWLAPWTEALELCRNDFRTILQLMDEYPEFIYTQASAQHFEWLEEKYPDLFNRIRSRVQEGRWELVGGMWVEPDLNLPDGESLVRQLVMGKRYFKSRFGVDVRVGWNLDSFGFSWQLPQIYKKAGIFYFVTTKLAWNDTTPFVPKHFWWEAPDGSRVLCYFPLGYDCAVDVRTIANELVAIVPSAGSPEIMYLYSAGDDGVREGRSALDSIRRLQAVSTAAQGIRFSTVTSFFEDTEEKLHAGELSASVWRDELYLQCHRGVFTTQAETKKQIRRSEVLLHNLEKLSAWTLIAGAEYPHQLLLGFWKTLLFNQFHDIMPGTGIAGNFSNALRDLDALQVAASALLADACRELVARIHVESPAVPVVVFNTLSWERSGSVLLEAQLPSDICCEIEVRDRDGLTVASEVLELDASTNRVRILALVTNIPPMGFTVVHIVPSAQPPRSCAVLRATLNEMENEYFHLTLDPATGNIVSLVNKSDGVDIIASESMANVLQVFSDTPKNYDAWDIDPSFEATCRVVDQTEEVTLLSCGPMRAGIRVSRKFQNSTIIQEIKVLRGVPYVEIYTRIDWRERRLLLKAAFPLNVNNPEATFEIPYGTIHRSVRRTSDAERAKFEVPALRWADLSDERRGLAVLNASKYGYDARDNVLRLTLLRSPIWPDPEADWGAHEFVYALYPHAGNWIEGQVTRRGYEINVPLIPMASTPHRGQLPMTQSFIDVRPSNIILSVIKKAEDDDALIVRFYEFEGLGCRTCVTLAKPATRAAETNLLEEVYEDLSLSSDGRVFTIPTEAFEIKTVKIWFAG